MTDFWFCWACGAVIVLWLGWSICRAAGRGESPEVTEIRKLKADPDKDPGYYRACIDENLRILRGLMRQRKKGDSK